MDLTNPIRTLGVWTLQILSGHSAYAPYTSYQDTWHMDLTNPIRTPGIWDLPITKDPIYLESNLILFSHLHLGLPSGLFPSGLSMKCMYSSSLPCVLRVLPIPSSST
jgi:hypothetical protein